MVVRQHFLHRLGVRLRWERAQRQHANAGDGEPEQDNDDESDAQN